MAMGMATFLSSAHMGEKITPIAIDPVPQKRLLMAQKEKVEDEEEGKEGRGI